MSLRWNYSQGESLAHLCALFSGKVQNRLDEALPGVPCKFQNLSDLMIAEPKLARSWRLLSIRSAHNWHCSITFVRRRLKLKQALEAFINPSHTRACYAGVTSHQIYNAIFR